MWHVQLQTDFPRSHHIMMMIQLIAPSHYQYYLELHVCVKNVQVKEFIANIECKSMKVLGVKGGKPSQSHKF